jgi:hypothetical protein
LIELKKLAWIEKYLKGTKYNRIVEAVLLERSVRSDTKFLKNEQKQKDMLAKLPNTEILLAELVEKLKGKSVYSTIKKISLGEGKDDYMTLKGLSSLLTHAVIECEHGNKEFRCLLPVIMEKLNELVYKL